MSKPRLGLYTEADGMLHVGHHLINFLIDSNLLWIQVDASGHNLCAVWSEGAPDQIQAFLRDYR